jgi:hypothetical protein
MALENEVNDLLNGMIGPDKLVAEEPPAPETPPVEEPPVVPPVETPKEEPPAAPEEPPAVTSPTAEPAKPPAQEAPLVETPVVPMLSEDQSTIVSLRQQLEELAARTLGVPPVAAEKPAETPKEEKPIAVGAPVAVAPVSTGGVFTFVKSEEEFDEAMKTAEGFNKILTSVVQLAQENILKTVPQVVVRLADSQITMRGAIQEFYTHNEDLVANKAYVGMIANELASKNPDWTLDKLLGQLGKEVRGRLKMTVKDVKVPEDKPAFVPKGGGGKPPSAPALNGQDKQIIDLIS